MAAAHFDSFNVPIFFPLSRFHDIFKKKENKEERERVFFYIIFKDLNGIANFYSSVYFTRMQINRFLIINYDNILLFSTLCSIYVLCER